MNQQQSGERKDSRSLDPAMRDYPALLKIIGAAKLASLRQSLRLFDYFSAARLREMAPKQPLRID